MSALHTVSRCRPPTLLWESVRIAFHDASHFTHYGQCTILDSRSAKDYSGKVLYLVVLVAWIKTHPPHRHPVTRQPVTRPHVFYHLASSPPCCPPALSSTLTPSLSQASVICVVINHERVFLFSFTVLALPAVYISFLIGDFKCIFHLQTKAEHFSHIASHGAREHIYFVATVDHIALIDAFVIFITRFFFRSWYSLKSLGVTTADDIHLLALKHCLDEAIAHLYYCSICIWYKLYPSRR